MRYTLKHCGVYSGKKTPTFYVLFLIQGNLWAGELWDLPHCAQKQHCRNFYFFYFSMEAVLVCFGALSIPAVLLVSSLHEEAEQVAWLSDQH